MNPSRKKIPYPFCGISDINIYNSLKVSKKIRNECQGILSESILKENYITAFATSIKSNLNFVCQQNIGKFYSKIEEQINSKILNQQSMQIDEQILSLIRENTTLMQIMSDYDNKIQKAREKLDKLQQEYGNQLILKNQQLNEMRYPLQYLKDQYRNIRLFKSKQDLLQAMRDGKGKSNRCTQAKHFKLENNFPKQQDNWSCQNLKKLKCKAQENVKNDNK